MAEKEGFGNQGVNAVEPAFSKCPPDIYIKLFKFLLNPNTKKNLHQKVKVLSMAEKEGFEPSIPFWGIHDFQSCALGQLRDFSMRLLASLLQDSFDIILRGMEIVKHYFRFLPNFSKGCRPGRLRSRPGRRRCL